MQLNKGGGKMKTFFKEYWAEVLSVLFLFALAGFFVWDIFFPFVPNKKPGFNPLILAVISLTIVLLIMNLVVEALCQKEGEIEEIEKELDEG